jgi:hypothetical protein
MRLGLPWVDYGHASGLKVSYIPSHDFHAVNKRGGRDESVTVRARIRYVERCTPLRHSCINYKDATVECGQDISVHPCSEDRTLFPVTPFDQKDSDFQFQY